MTPGGFHLNGACELFFENSLPLSITLQQLYETSGDVEAYGLSNLLATYTGVASVVFLSEVLDILARANASMQTKLADFSKFPIFLKVMIDQLDHMKEETSEWLGTVETVISQLQEKYDTVLGKTWIKKKQLVIHYKRV